MHVAPVNVQLLQRKKEVGLLLAITLLRELSPASWKSWASALLASQTAVQLMMSFLRPAGTVVVTSSKANCKLHREELVYVPGVVQVGVALFVQLAKSATILSDIDWKGEPTGATQEVTAFEHGIENFYDPNGKGWWKKFGMVNMHPAVLKKLSDTEVCLGRTLF